MIELLGIHISYIPAEAHVVRLSAVEIQLLCLIQEAYQ